MNLNTSSEIMDLKELFGSDNVPLSNRQYFNTYE